ncbi:SH3 domain-containing protein C23A1.17-like [Zingiber officinale]|uniref:SH3 domain-containing protein C23A1.17-like n=1 Tax=Zingiber officinale TaxID=94328 RepID=UPI001C4B5DE4|nr:SH3 domain-containing protein C23A1.17-like [Zingiber officinale]
MARSPSDDSDSDDQPLSQRRRRRAPRVIPDSSPSSLPSPPHATDFTPSHQVTPPPIPSHVDGPPILSSNQAEPPLAQPFSAQHAQGDEVGPSTRPSVTPPPPAEPSQGPSSAPSGATAEPSATPGSAAGPSGPPPLTTEPSATPSSAAGPSGPPPLTYQDYCTTFPSEAQLWSQTDVPTNSLKMKDTSGIFQASHALRAEIKSLTTRKNSLEVSLALTEHELEELQEKQSQADNVHQQSMNQQALEHQRVMDQLVQKLRAAETLMHDQDQKLKSQEVLLKSRETQLTSQATKLTTARNELAQAMATTEGVSTALALYREGESDRCLRHRAEYLRSPEFCAQVGHRFSTSAIYGTGGALRQLHEQDYLRSIPPPEFLDHDRIIKEIPDEIFAPFD